MFMRSYYLRTSHKTKIETKTVADITNETKAMVTKLNMDDRVIATAERETFITLRDRKPTPNVDLSTLQRWKSASLAKTY